MAGDCVDACGWAVLWGLGTHVARARGSSDVVCMLCRTWVVWVLPGMFGDFGGLGVFCGTPWQSG